jgi:hypothetical protein
LNRKRAYITGLGLTIILLYSFAAFPGGIGLDLSVLTVNLSGALDMAPQAATSALSELGLSAPVIDQVLQELNATLTDIERSFPVDYFPIPMVGGTLEFGLPLIVINKVVFSVASVNDTILRGIAGMVGYSIPQPLVVDTVVDLGGDTASVSADVGFSVFKLTSQVAKHFDLLFAGIELGAGVDFTKGNIVPQVAVNAPGHQADVDSALDALHLDGLGWSEFTASLSGQIELGPPFLRLVAQGGYQLPISVNSGWWDIKNGTISAKIGLAVRF